MKRLLQDVFPDDLPVLTSDSHVRYSSGAKHWIIIDDRYLQSSYVNRDPGSKINLWCEPNCLMKQKETIADALVGAATAIVKKLQPQDANTPKRVSSATNIKSLQ